MRGEDRMNVNLFSYVDLESRVPSGHPLRASPVGSVYAASA
jgi:hypothetical protein